MILPSTPAGFSVLKVTLTVDEQLVNLQECRLSNCITVFSSDRDGDRALRFV